LQLHGTAEDRIVNGKAAHSTVRDLYADHWSVASPSVHLRKIRFDWAHSRASSRGCRRHADGTEAERSRSPFHWGRRKSPSRPIPMFSTPSASV
jgi:hypothetical protein